MPATLGNTTTTDNYRDTRLGGGSLFASGTILVANNPVSLLLTVGRSFGEEHDVEFPYVNPSTIPLIAGQATPDQKSDVEYIVGVQFKSAIVGKPAQVAGWLIEPQQAGLAPGTPFTQTI